MKHLRIAALVLAFGLAACASLAPHQQTIDQGLLQAESVATAALSTATTLLTAGKITLAQDKQIRRSHDVVIAAVHTAHDSLEMGNAAGAQGQLAAIQADIALLQSFLTNH